MLSRRETNGATGNCPALLMESSDLQPSSTMGHKIELQSAAVEDEASALKFKPGPRFYAAFGSLCVVILAAALDATSLSVALPV